MSIDAATLAKADRLFPALRDMPAALRARVANEARLITVPAGTHLFDEHSPCSGFPLLLEGSVRVSKLAPNGREILLYRVQPGECCVLSSGCLLGHTDYAAAGTAESTTTLLALGRELFDELLSVDAGFRSMVFNLFAERLSELMLLIEEVAFRRLDERLAAWLIAHGPEVRITHQALAEELGSVREIISRLLGSFADRGWVELGRSRIEVRDAAALKRIAVAS